MEKKIEYNNQNVRRQDRLLEEENAYQLLNNGEYGVLSLTKENGEAYGIPISYVWDGTDAIYLHCAPVGDKLKCLAYNANVSFCIVGQTHVIPNKFTTAYESILLSCEAETGLNPEERMHALDLLLRKYSPNDRETGLKYAEKSFHRTEIIRLRIRTFSGKCKRC